MELLRKRVEILQGFYKGKEGIVESVDENNIQVLIFGDGLKGSIVFVKKEDLDKKIKILEQNE